LPLANVLRNFKVFDVATDSDIFDITILGGGPVGLYAAYYAGLRQMRTKIIDSLDQLGGQLATLYPEKYIYDVAGFPKVIARDLVKNLVDQAQQYEPQVCLSQTVKTLTRDEAAQCFVLSSDQEVHRSRTVLICAGAGAFQARKLPVAEAAQWEGRGVHYSVGSKQVFAGKRLLIIGGGDSALDWAMNLHGTASHITIIHRRNQFRAHEDSVSKTMAMGIPILTFWELKSLVVTDNHLSGAVLVNNQTHAEQTIQVDAILPQLGFISSLGAIKDWPIQIRGQSILVDQKMQTNLPGVFAAGDVAGFDGKLKLIATGFGEAATAVNFAKTLLDPKAKAFPGHSSEMGPQTVTTIGMSADVTVA
jgi:thioredoxin reductase (NADPH)